MTKDQEWRPENPERDENRRGALILQLFVTGTTVRSVRAIRNIREICESGLPCAYELEVVDIYQQPSLAAQEQIVAVPTLIKHGPGPVQRFIGDLSDKQRVLEELNLGSLKGLGAFTRGGNR